MTFIEQLIEDFELLDTWENRFNYIMELGEKLPSIPEEDKTEANLVRGCTSKSWVKGKFTDGTFDFVADSEAVIGRGMLSLARSIYAGKTAREVLGIDMLDFANRTGLMEHLTPTRQKGLHALITRIRDLATQQLAAEGQPNPRD
uniref:Cysteine desulfuration protein SufE n=1 Tax=Candidatus Kentrum sp. TC TaxID=2126339 RepID=A0A450YL96_9GAMM|nr:MAG: cysteine desulfuration protein SufE [Candidatus Kentron sp. TC]VFK49183.1 MAG: Cysteine desulfuration protein SufE [Candidatus Kentron sp. TC]VFK56162.1 MAG: cysteine desulfuration protein SufE [Candidatus Kentron sp. TC]